MSAAAAPRIRRHTGAAPAITVPRFRRPAGAAPHLTPQEIAR